MSQSFCRRCKVERAIKKQSRAKADISGLLKEIPACQHEPSRQLAMAVVLMNYAERDPETRNQMIENDAIPYLLLAFDDSPESNRGVRSALALAIAYLLRSFYPRKIPSLTKDKKRAIFRILAYLRDSKKELAIDGVEISTQTLAYVAAQARNYFTLLGSSTESRGKLGGGSKSVVPSHGLQPERTFGAVKALGIETYVYFLGSTAMNHKLGAVMAIIKIAKECPTQRALMHNYGVATRLVDIVRSVVDEHMKIAAALALAYILPTLDSSILVSASGEARESLRILEARDRECITVNGVNISSQEMTWAIECLRNISSPNWNATTEGMDVMKLKNVGLMILSNLDLKVLYDERKVTE
jgi:hypothetical protein